MEHLSMFLNKEVSHTSFGDGIVTGITGNIVEISFDGSTKKFSFPNSFRKHILFKENILQVKMNEFISQYDSEKANAQPKETSFPTRFVQEVEVTSSQKASEIIRNKLIQNGGEATYKTLEGKEHIFKICNYNQSFSSPTGLPNIIYDFTVFDCVTTLMFENLKKNSRTLKGCARGHEDKVGYGKCGYDTVVGAIAKNYAGKKQGESACDPSPAICGIMEWAGIIHNRRGYIEFTNAYLQMCCSK